MVEGNVAGDADISTVEPETEEAGMETRPTKSTEEEALRNYLNVFGPRKGGETNG
jgi:hypothetical protein